MTSPLRIIDGSKAAQFDGLFLEVSGINGSADSKRVGVQMIEKVGVAQAGEEWMFMVKAKNGGFSAVISTEKKGQWEQLATTIMEARAQLG
ncbi:hypothetical protein KBD61_04265 [Patescibacteria group bacterium]|nr:hypothetical protein [Patescibacteria group bacterium]MBP9710208.1 hypothetical protein [Patescibacteria group bacterium]